MQGSHSHSVSIIILLESESCCKNIQQATLYLKNLDVSDDPFFYHLSKKIFKKDNEWIKHCVCLHMLFWGVTDDNTKAHTEDWNIHYVKVSPTLNQWTCCFIRQDNSLILMSFTRDTIATSNWFILILKVCSQVKVKVNWELCCLVNSKTSSWTQYWWGYWHFAGDLLTSAWVLLWVITQC